MATVDFRVYKDGYLQTGIAQADLPPIAFMTAEIKGGGVLGAIDMPIIGAVQSMPMTLNFQSITPDYKKMCGFEVQEIELRASVQVNEPSTGRIKTDSHKYFATVIPKNHTLGQLIAAEKSDRTMEFEALTLKYMINDDVIFEIDKRNYVLIINGVDYLAQVRKDLGLS